MLDSKTEFGAHVVERLHKENVAWLTTVGSDLAPQPRPVWFVWEDGTFLIYSQPNAAKIRHIQEHPRVALNLNSDENGDDIVVFIGKAEIVETAPSPTRNKAYLDKYGEALKGMEMSDEELASYSTAIRVTPTGMRGH